jgi:integrase
VNTTPTITIYTRHSAGCKYANDEFAKRCDCRKWLRWSHNGVRHRRKADTRSWAEAERVKRDLEDQLTGRNVVSEVPGTKNIRAAIDVFLADKKVEGISTDLMRKYERGLNRLAAYCDSRGVYTLAGIDREFITRFCADWDKQYPSSVTRNKLRARYISFMKFCVDAKWIAEAPKWPKMKADEVPTLPLTDEEFDRLLDSVYVVVRAPQNHTVENQSHEYWCKKVRGLFLLMRWSGLSIMDALTLPRRELIADDKGHRVVTKRTKTGTPVSVRLPPEIAEELLAIPNDNPEYLFWSGRGKAKSICGNWGKRFIKPCFDEAGIRGGHMTTHRLRDTFACGLLKSGVSLENTSRLLGHTSIRTTEKSYAAWVPSRQRVLDVEVEKAWAESVKAKARPGRKRLPSADLHLPVSDVTLQSLARDA